MISLIIPAYNEEKSIEETVRAYNLCLKDKKIKHEILVVYDKSLDRTEEVLKELEKSIKELRCISNYPQRGFGSAIARGLKEFKGEYVSIVMGDHSDDENDLLRYYCEIQKGYDCVFGSRFVRGGKVIHYPVHKLILNRIVNNVIKILFMMKYNDTTNAFKIYRRETIRGLEPIISQQFNITVELPLKAIIRGYSYSVIPISWTNRKKGSSKLKIDEMGSRYLFIILYCWLEKLLSKGDYKKSKKALPS